MMNTNLFSALHLADFERKEFPFRYSENGYIETVCFHAVPVYGLEFDVEVSKDEIHFDINGYFQPESTLERMGLMSELNEVQAWLERENEAYLEEECED